MKQLNFIITYNTRESTNPAFCPAVHMYIEVDKIESCILNYFARCILGSQKFIPYLNLNFLNIIRVILSKFRKFELYTNSSDIPVPTQPEFTCLKLTIETLEQVVRYVQS